MRAVLPACILFKIATAVIALMLHPDVRDDLSLQNAPLPHQKAKARNLKRNFNRYLETYYRQRGIPRLMVQHPAQAHL